MTPVIGDKKRSNCIKRRRRIDARLLRHSTVSVGARALPTRSTFNTLVKLPHQYARAGVISRRDQADCLRQAYFFALCRKERVKGADLTAAWEERIAIDKMSSAIGLCAGCG